MSSVPVFDTPVRNVIFTLAEANPGLSGQELRSYASDVMGAELPFSTYKHNENRLAEEGYFVKHPHHGRKRIVVSGSVQEDAVPRILYETSPRGRKMLESLRDSETGLSISDAARLMSTNRSIAKTWLEGGVEAGLVDRDRTPYCTLYFLREG